MTKKKKGKKEQPEGPNAIDFVKLIKRASLDGNPEVEDALLVIEDGMGTIKAFDNSGGIYTHTEAPVDLKDGEYGLGKLAPLYGYIKNNADKHIDIQKKKNRLIFTIKGHGKLLYLLVEPGAIKSQPDEEKSPDPADLLEGFSYSLPLKKQVVADLKSYIEYIKPRTISITVNEKGSVTFSGGAESESKFTLKAGKLVEIDNAEEGDYPEEAVSILAERLSIVLKLLEWEDDAPELLIGDEQIPVIRQNETTLWGINRQATTEDE